MQKSCHAQIQNSTALLGSHYMVYRSQFTSERFGPTLYSSIRQASAVSFASILEKDSDGDESLIKKLTNEMYSCKAFQ